MLRASVSGAVVLSFMILMCPAHGSLPLHAQQPPATARPSSIADRTIGMQKIDGYFPLYWDDRTGSLFIEIPRFDTEFLLNVGLAAGLGSNDIGLDRGEGGGARIVSFHRVGPRVLLVQPNLSFRSSSANLLERKSVEDSFATSVLWGFIVAIAGAVWWWAFRRWRHPLTWLIGVVPFLVLLFPFYVYLERALPNGY